MGILVKLCAGNEKGRDILGYVRVRRRITLNWTFKKQGLKLLNWFNRLKVWSSGRVLRVR